MLRTLMGRCMALMLTSRWRPKTLRIACAHQKISGEQMSITMTGITLKEIGAQGPSNLSAHKNDADVTRSINWHCEVIFARGERAGAASPATQSVDQDSSWQQRSAGVALWSTMTTKMKQSPRTPRTQFCRGKPILLETIQERGASCEGGKSAGNPATGDGGAKAPSMSSALVKC